MDQCTPLTVAQPWETVPGFAGLDSLFPDLEPNGYRPVEVTASFAEEGGRRVPVHVVIAEADAARAIGFTFGLVRDLPGYEVTVRPFTA